MEALDSKQPTTIFAGNGLSGFRLPLVFLPLNDLEAVTGGFLKLSFVHNRYVSSAVLNHSGLLQDTGGNGDAGSAGGGLLIITAKHFVFSRHLIWSRLSRVLVLDVLQALHYQVQIGRFDFSGGRKHL